MSHLSNSAPHRPSPLSAPAAVVQYGSSPSADSILSTSEHTDGESSFDPTRQPSEYVSTSHLHQESSKEAAADKDRAELEHYRQQAIAHSHFEAFAGSRTGSPIPDNHGLGWPGKGTLARLHSTPAETAAREAKLAGAVRTLLECIGEDPERDGLIKTPERYAKALLWMTKGYEERLPGEQSAFVALETEGHIHGG